MGYFPNGTAGMLFEEQWCSKCVHQENCAVWTAHMIHNYAECNNDGSILHLLIPKDADTCNMFHEPTP